MTKQEIAEIIESKGKECGFKVKETSTGWMTEQTSESFARVEIFTKTNNERTSWKDRRVCLDIEAVGTICRMGGNTTPEELFKAADEIARGAKFTAELQSMRLSYERTF